MLVLSRTKGQSIQIGPSIVTLLSIRGGSVRLGITAAADVEILRSELLPAEVGPNGWIEAALPDLDLAEV
jgi:carbon storage regulator CsrA